MSLYLGDNLISGRTVTIDRTERIGQIIVSTLPLTDAGVHLLDGALISGSGTYSDFVNYIADLYTKGTCPNAFDTEANWQTSVTTYGVCGKFVYDDVNNTVRLPKITGFTEGTIDPTVVGDIAQQNVKLPNITGKFALSTNGSAGASLTGAFFQEGTTNQGAGGNAGTSAYAKLDASRSSSVYSGNGSNTTIHPQSIKVLYYIVIATTTKTEIESDIDNIATDLNGKADVDLTNVNNSGMVRSVHWVMPSTTYDNLTVGSSGATYTAPADGWVKFSATTNNNNQFIQIYSTMTSIAVASGTLNLDACIPIRKGDTFQIWYTAPNNKALRFYYAVGSESEAS